MADIENNIVGNKYRQVNVLEYLDATATLTGDKQAFVESDGEAVTFGELAAVSARIGTFLADVVCVGEAVTVVADKSCKTVSLYLAVLKAGGHYVPIDKGVHASRKDAILETVKPRVVLTDDRESLVGTVVPPGTLVFEYAEMADTAPDEQKLAKLRNAVIDTDPAYVIFTSGSTGKPKGVIGTHRSLIDYIDAITEVTQVCSDDILGNQAPLDYIAGVRDMFVCLKTGAKVELIPQQFFTQPAYLFEHLNDRKVTVLFWVAPALSICAELDAFSHVVPKYVSKVIFTGSVLPNKDLRKWQDSLPDALFVNQYGPTEITASCTYYLVEDKVNPDGSLPIGIPFRNTGILLLREDGTAAGIGEEGEICVRGTGISPGYYRDINKTRESFVSNPLNEIYDEIIYRTGDIGRYNEREELIFVGRRDSQIKHMGHRIELGEIEDAALDVEGVEQSVVIYDATKRLICLFYTGSADRASISKALRDSLPGYMIPKKYLLLEQIPLLPNGKYDKNKLKQELTNGATDGNGKN